MRRERLVDLWAFFISRNYVTFNEAATLKRSLSKKLAANKKWRRRLELDDYKAILNHKDCPHWLKIAMELSYVTLQTRKEIAMVKYSDERDGHLFFIRDKVSARSKMAFIKVVVTPIITDILDRSRADNLCSPFIVHRAPNPQGGRPDAGDPRRG